MHWVAQHRCQLIGEHADGASEKSSPAPLPFRYLAPHEKLEHKAGYEIKFDNILLLGDSDGIKVGDALSGASVTAKVVAHGRADKVRIIKFRRRKHHMKRQGHRQYYTEIEITGIAGGNK